MGKEQGLESVLDNSLKKIVKSSFIVLVAIFFSKILAYLYKVVIARYFGPELYGIFSILLVLSGWMIAFSSLGLSDGLIRFIPLLRGKRDFKKIKYLLKLSAQVQIVSSIVSAIVLYLISDFIAISIFHNPSLSFILKVFSLFLPFSVLGYLIISVIRGYEEITAFSIIYNITPNLFRLLFLVFFIYLGLKEGAVVLSFCLGLFFMFFISYSFFKYKLSSVFLEKNINKKAKADIKAELFAYSFPVLFFGIISTIFYWIDSISLGYLKSMSEVGIYNAAVPIAMLLGITLDLFGQMFFPFITRQYSRKNFNLIKDISKNVTKWIFMINLPVFILLLFFPGVIIRLLFGADYLGAENPLRILLIGTFLSSLAGVANNLLYMAGKSKLVLYDMLLAATLNVVLNFLLIPRDFIFGINNFSGLVGAATATLFSGLLLNTLFLFQAAKYTKIFPFKKRLLRIALILVIPFVLLCYTKSKIPINLLSAVLLAFAFLGIYFIFLVLFRGFDQKDKMIFQAIIERLFNRVES